MGLLAGSIIRERSWRQARVLIAQLPLRGFVKALLLLQSFDVREADETELLRPGLVREDLLRSWRAMARDRGIKGQARSCLCGQRVQYLAPSVCRSRGASLGRGVGRHAGLIEVGRVGEKCQVDFVR